MPVGASFRELLSEDTRRDPFPYYARLHSQGPAIALGPGSRFAVVVCGYDAATQVLRDNRHFSSEVYVEMMGPVLQRMGLDPRAFAQRTAALQYIVRASKRPERA